MRTREARRNRNKALKRTKRMGHDVRLISRSGAVELYGCMNCTDTMDCWDSPAIVNGPMPERKCSGADPARPTNYFSYYRAYRVPSFISRFIKAIGNLMRKSK